MNLPVLVLILGLQQVENSFDVMCLVGQVSNDNFVTANFDDLKSRVESKELIIHG